MEVFLKKSDETVSLLAANCSNSRKWEVVIEMNSREGLRTRRSKPLNDPKEEMLTQALTLLWQGFSIQANTHPLLGDQCTDRDALHTAVIRCRSNNGLKGLVRALARADVDSSTFRLDPVHTKEQAVSGYQVTTAGAKCWLNAGGNGYAAVTKGSVLAQCLCLLDSLPDIDVVFRRACPTYSTTFVEGAGGFSVRDLNYVELNSLVDAINTTPGSVTTPTDWRQIKHPNRAVIAVDYQPIFDIDGGRLNPVII